MLRESPFNYLISLIITFTIWLLTSFGILPWLSENITTLKEISLEEIESLFRIFLAIAGFIPFILACFWFYWGDKPIAAADTQKAKKIWYILFFATIGLSIILEIAIIFYLILINEMLSLLDYIVLYLALALQTFLLFWLITFFFSPINVKYIPLFKK